MHFTDIRTGINSREKRRALQVLNKFAPSGHGEAQVQYLDGDFRVISPGTYVRCAVTDARIPLDELKYWSVDLQEAYALPTRCCSGISRRAEALALGFTGGQPASEISVARAKQAIRHESPQLERAVEFQLHGKGCDAFRP